MEILITGAAGGLGRATAEKLAEKGHHVYAGVHTYEQLHDILSSPHNCSITFFKHDVTDPVDKQLCAELPIDVYIANAALGMGGSMSEIDIDLVRKTFETNVFSMFEIAQKVLPGMIAKGEGRLIFMSSLSGDIPFQFLSPYEATKASIDVMATALRQEMSHCDAHIKVSVIKPGAYHTGFNQRIIDSNVTQTKDLDIFGKNKREHIARKERLIFDVLEKQNIDPIVEKICHAALSKHPHAKYSSPPSHKVGAKMSAILMR